MIWFLGWIGFSGLVAVFASGRGRNPGAWFLLALLLSPLLTFIALAVMPNLTLEMEKARIEQKAAEAAADSKACPRCAETVKSAALVCRYCGYEFAAPSPVDATPVAAAPPAPSQAAKIVPEMKESTPLFILGIILVGAVGIYGGAAWFDARKEAPPAPVRADAVPENGWQDIYVLELGAAHRVWIDPKFEKDRSVYDRAIAAVCRANSPRCHVEFWIERAAIPASQPLTEAQMAAKSADYWKTGLTSTFLWNCRIHSVKSECFS